jgi:hypothetical protein
MDSSARAARAAGTASSVASSVCTFSAAAAACGCRYQCSLVAGTVFESSKVPLTNSFLAMHLMTHANNNVSALELKRHLRVSDRQLTGRVEIDDSYLGGEVQGGKAACGSPKKLPFVAAVQTTESGQPALIWLSQRPFTKESTQAFAARSLAAPATLVSNGLGCFTAVRGTGILHEPHVTGGGVARARHPAFLAVNTVLGNIKTSFIGAYHAFGFSSAHSETSALQSRFWRNSVLLRTQSRIKLKTCGFKLLLMVQRFNHAGGCRPLRVVSGKNQPV